MNIRFFVRSGLAALIVMGALSFAHAGKKDDAPACDLNFTVLKDQNSKPVKYASVILHPVKEGKQQKGGLQLKTNEEGQTHVEGIPCGTMRLQVIAKGFQTYGEDVEIAPPSKDFTIRMKQPAEQYSIYK